MRKLYTIFLAALMMFAGCTESYDDSAIVGKYDELQKEVNNLEEKIKELQTLLNALSNNLTIVSVQEYNDGYIITFSDGS